MQLGDGDFHQILDIPTPQKPVPYDSFQPEPFAPPPFQARGGFRKTKLTNKSKKNNKSKK